MCLVTSNGFADGCETDEFLIRVKDLGISSAAELPKVFRQVFTTGNSLKLDTISGRGSTSLSPEAPFV